MLLVRSLLNPASADHLQLLQFPDSGHTVGKEGPWAGFYNRQSCLKLCGPFLQRIRFLKWCNQWCSNVKNHLCAQLNLPVWNQGGSGWEFPNCTSLAQGSCVLSLEDCVDKMPSDWDHGAQTLCSLQTSHQFILFLPADRKLHSSCSLKLRDSCHKTESLPITGNCPWKCHEVTSFTLVSWGLDTLVSFE